MSVASTPRFVVVVCFLALSSCLIFAHAPGSGRIIVHEELIKKFPHKVGGDSSCNVTGHPGVSVYLPPLFFNLFKHDRKHHDHLLQSLFHLRIHAGLQNIEQNSVSIGKPQVVRGQECVQNGPQNELQITNSEK